MACHLFPDSIARPQPFNQIHYPTPLLPHSSSLSVSSSPSSTVFSLRFHSLKLFTGCTGRTIAVLNRSIKYGSFCVQPKNAYSADLCLKSVKNFNKAHNGTQMNCSGRSCKSVIARSDLVHDGIPDSPYSVAEAQFSAKARGVCFYAVTAINAVFLFVLMLVGHPFVLILDPYRRRFQHLVAKVWASLTIAPFYKVEFVGLEHLPGPDVPSVYVSNHQSFLDIYTLLTLGRSFKFISKTSIFLLPIIGWAMFLMGVIPLKRMDSRSQLECLKRCMDLIKGGASVFFFPEGTRSKDGKLGTFKKGAFSVAAKTGVPVVPITLHGTGNIMPAGKEGLLYPGSVKVVIHKPLESKDPVELCNEARNVIARTLDCES